jgi:hypothetical protein
MASRFSLPLSLLTAMLLIASPGYADITFVDEDFESYADNAALFAVWGAANTDAATLVDENFTEFLSLDDLEPQEVGARAYPSGGQGVQHIGGTVLEYQLPLNGGVPLQPSESQSIVLQGDIFDVGAFGNKRMSIGLRSTTPANLVEIGHWNESPVEYASRTILFGSPTPVSAQPNWQFYELPLALDRPDDLDEVTTLADIGEAWHTHRATITPTTITYQIDLFRDGLDAATGLAGFDATMTFDVEPTASGFNNIRIGGPSNSSSTGNGFYGGVFFDNILLKLEDVVTAITGDYNADGTVDAADYTLWRDTLGQSAIPSGTGADGNNNGVIDDVDYNLWRTNYGMTTMPPSAASVAAPEPSAAMLLLGAMGLAGIGCRSKKG